MFRSVRCILSRLIGSNIVAGLTDLAHVLRPYGINAAARGKADLGNRAYARSGVMDVRCRDCRAVLSDQLIDERGRKLVNSRSWPLYIEPVLYIRSSALQNNTGGRPAGRRDRVRYSGQAALTTSRRLLTLDRRHRGQERFPPRARGDRRGKPSDGRTRDGVAS
jgi:hypothetical protein